MLLLCRCFIHRRPDAFIQIKIRSVDSVIDDSESNPFPFARINSEIADNLVSAAMRQLWPKQKCKILFYSKESDDVDKVDKLKNALRNHLENDIKSLDRQMTYGLSSGIVSSLIGLTVILIIMFIWFVLTEELDIDTNSSSRPWQFFKTVATIIIWIAIWIPNRHPTEILLFDRYEARYKKMVSCVLAKAEIEIRPLSEISISEGLLQN